MFSYLRLGLPLVLLVALVGCGPDYSPNTYSSAAVQQANKVDQGLIAGFREVAIRADGTVGAVTGGAAGGVLGAQYPGGGINTALTAIGGTFIGGLVGATVEHTADDTKAFEYLVRKATGELISVTQRDVTPLSIGLKVLVIEGKQARVVPDYSVPADTSVPSAADAAGKSGTKAETKNGGLNTTNNMTDRTDDTGKITNDVKATDAPGDTGPPAPAQTPQAEGVDTAPAPPSGEMNSATASQPIAPQGPAPEAVTPTPQTTPAPAGDPEPLQAGRDGTITSAEPTQAPVPSSDGAPTP